MDIQAALHKPISSTVINRSNSVSNKVQFKDFVAREEKREVSNRLNELMGAIEKQGNRLSQSQSIDNLKKYKKHVKDFMNYVKQNAMKLENKDEFNGFGQGRTMQTIRTVDKKLIDLTEEILKKESDSGLRVLGLIGEVKGLLLDLTI